MPEEFTAVADCHRKPGIRLLVQPEDDGRKVSAAGERACKDEVVRG